MTIATTSTTVGRSPLRHLPVVAAALAVIAVALLAAAPLGWRAGWWQFRFSLLTLLPWAAYLGLAALALSTLLCCSAARASSGEALRSPVSPLS